MSGDRELPGSGPNRYVPLDALMAMDFPPIRWAVDGVLPAGSAILAGAPKVGKSSFALSLGIAIAAGGKAFGGIDVEPGTVIYYALEDGGLRRVQTRAAAMLNGSPPPPGLIIDTQLPRLDDGGLAELEARIAATEPRLVLLDTLKRIRPLTTANRRAYDEDYEALANVTDLAAEANVSITAIHHTREMSADDWLDSVSGSRGITAAVDTVIAATRGRGTADAVLRITGRDLPDTEFAFDVDPATFTWRLLGDADHYAMRPERRKIIDALEDLDAATPAQIADEIGEPVVNVRKLIRTMADASQIKDAGGGLYRPLTRPGSQP